MARMSIAQFRVHPYPTGITATVAGLLNAGPLMSCHLQMYAVANIWIDDLTEILQKMDAYILTQPLPNIT